MRIPAYDKSAHAGQGDRAEDASWEVVNQESEGTVDVVLFEGWCVGFRALENRELERKWKEAVEMVRLEDAEAEGSSTEKKGRMKGRLGRQELKNLKTVNDALKGYDALTE